MTSQNTIADFLSQRSFAVVGVSRDGRKFGNTIYRTLKSKGYRVFAVNRNAETIEGDACYHHLGDVPERVDGVVVCVPPEQAEQVVHDALGTGIRRIWFQQGAASYAAIRQCEKNEISMVSGQCILMFVEPVTSIHRFHRWVWKVIGKYPASDPPSSSHPS
jgi:predicted CoA-binding protein